MDGRPGQADFAGTRANLILVALGLYILFNTLGIAGNLAGRVTLSEIFGNTAVYVLAQTISLTVFVQILVESFLLQIKSIRIRKKYPTHFEFAGIAHSVSRGASILAAVLWLIVFTTNLNLFDTINDRLTDLFNTVRQVGNFSFTLGGIALFAGIIWVANFLQRYITYFFGDTGDDAAMDDKGQRSKLPKGDASYPADTGFSACRGRIGIIHRQADGHTRRAQRRHRPWFTKHRKQFHFGSDPDLRPAPAHRGYCRDWR